MTLHGPRADSCDMHAHAQFRTASSAGRDPLRPSWREEPAGSVPYGLDRRVTSVIAIGFSRSDPFAVRNVSVLQRIGKRKPRAERSGRIALHSIAYLPARAHFDSPTAAQAPFNACELCGASSNRSVEVELPRDAAYVGSPGGWKPSGIWLPQLNSFDPRPDRPKCFSSETGQLVNSRPRRREDDACALLRRYTRRARSLSVDADEIIQGLTRPTRSSNSVTKGLLCFMDS
jgi:hypothetical protein